MTCLLQGMCCCMQPCSTHRAGGLAAGGCCCVCMSRALLLPLIAHSSSSGGGVRVAYAGFAEGVNVHAVCPLVLLPQQGLVLCDHTQECTCLVLGATALNHRSTWHSFGMWYVVGCVWQLSVCCHHPHAFPLHDGCAVCCNAHAASILCWQGSCWCGQAPVHGRVRHTTCMLAGALCSESCCGVEGGYRSRRSAVVAVPLCMTLCPACCAVECVFRLLCCCCDVAICMMLSCLEQQLCLQGAVRPACTVTSGCVAVWAPMGQR